MDILIEEKNRIEARKQHKGSVVLGFRIDAQIMKGLAKIAEKRDLLASTAAKIIITDYVLNHPETKKTKT